MSFMSLDILVLACVLIALVYLVEKVKPERRMPLTGERSPKDAAVKTTTARKSISNNWQAHLANKNAKISAAKSDRLGDELASYYNTMRYKKVNPRMRPNVSGTGTLVGTESGGRPDAKKLTSHVAMDCEMVGIGPAGTDSMLARVSLVNKFGECVFDSFVAPRERVTDYRTPVSGVRKADLDGGSPFEEVQKRVAEILKGRVLVGHALKNDLDVLFISHPKYKTRDTSKYPPFRSITKGFTPSLKVLCQKFLDVNIQSGEHSSLEDARATMQLYCLHSRQWEAWLSAKFLKRKAHPY